MSALSSDGTAERASVSVKFKDSLTRILEPKRRDEDDDGCYPSWVGENPKTRSRFEGRRCWLLLPPSSTERTQLDTGHHPAAPSALDTTGTQEAIILCLPSISTAQSSSAAWARSTVGITLMLLQSYADSGNATAHKDFDELLFEYGLELDGDVSSFLRCCSSQRLNISIPCMIDY